MTAVITQIHGAIDSPQRKLARQKALFEKGFLKLNFEIIQKNAFSGFCQKNSQAMDEVEILFCQFPNPLVLRVSGMGCYGLEM